MLEFLCFLHVICDKCVAVCNRNQADVGEGVRKSGVKREDVFITTKVWTNGYESCRDEFTASLKQSVPIAIIFQNSRSSLKWTCLPCAEMKLCTTLLPGYHSTASSLKSSPSNYDLTAIKRITKYTCRNSTGSHFHQIIIIMY